MINLKFQGMTKNNATRATESKDDHEKTTTNKKIASQPIKTDTTVQDNTNSSTAKFNDTIVYD